MLTLAWPLILTNLSQAAIHATDVILLGWLGPRSLAAGALGTNLVMACVIFGSGLMTATAPMIARELGRRRHSVRDVRRTVRAALWAAVVLVVPLWALLWNAEHILLAMGQDPGLATQAGRLVHAMMWGMLPFFGYVVLRNYVAALERPMWSLAIAVVAVVFNAIVNYGLVFGNFGLPRLEVVGAGIGSSLSNCIMFAGMALVVTRHPRFRRYRLFGHFWRADWERFRAVWRLGLPIAVTLALEATVFNAAVFLMGLISTTALAAHAVAIQIASLSFMIPLGLGQAATVRVGLAAGRGDRGGIARAGWTAFTLAEGVMLAVALVMIFSPLPLISAFMDVTDPGHADVVALAVSFLAVAGLFQLVDGAQVIGAAMLRGLHDTRIPMLFAGLGYWVLGLPVGAWLAFRGDWGGVGIWTGLALGLAIVSAMMLGRWMARERLGLVG